MEYIDSIIINCILVFSMLLISFYLKDLSDAKPARYAFRSFYFFNLTFMLCTGIHVVFDDNMLSSITLRVVDTLTDISLAAMTISALIAFCWRANKQVNLLGFGLFGFAYILIDGSIEEYSLSVSVGNVYTITCCIIAIYYIVNRRGSLNIGDKGLLLTISIFIAFIGYLLIFSQTTSQEPQAVEIFILSPSLLALFTIFILLSYMSDLHDRLHEQATTDSLTGIYNRRYFLEQGKKLLSYALRHHCTMSLIMCDIDKFKLVNDTYGHGIGDQVIIKFAHLLKNVIREEDIVARIGGEEFVILLPNTNLDEAVNFAERIRELTQAILIDTPHGTLKFTASFGVSIFDNLDIESNFKNADKALYLAKESGRNKVLAFN